MKSVFLYGFIGGKITAALVLSVIHSSHNGEFQAKKGTVIILHSECMVLLQKK